MTQLNLSDAIPNLPRRPVRELKAGERVDQVFLVTKKDLRATTNGGLYIHAIVSDKTGEMVARLWNASEDLYQGIPDGGLLRIRGRIDSYKGNPQLIIDGCQPADVNNVDMSEFMATSERDVEKMFAEMVKLLGGIKDADLNRLVQAVLSDADLMTQLKRAPAAMKNHHAYVGGLLEHTLSVMQAASRLFPQYPAVNPDLVLAGVFLHDIGKTSELSYGVGFDYTDDGHLLGHIYRGASYTESKAAELARAGQAVDPGCLRLLLHIILSHHGELAFGAPTLPKTREAFLVHYLDNLDAKMNTINRLISADRTEEADWTQYDQSLGRKIYKRDYASPHSTPNGAIAKPSAKPRKGGLE
ncbi:MAG: HD domain-containing protein [Phycisphaerae bacterium]|nr:HD domain-containing protein [Phycisphaerae bacterium]